MKSSFETMYSALSCTSLYSDDAENLRAELMAYATVFDEINKELCDMLNERFVCSAESYGLSEIERIIGAERNDLDIYKRRQSLMLRGAINSQCFTPDAIKEALRSFSFEFELQEFPQASMVVVKAVGEYSLSLIRWITAQVLRIMPAHLMVQVVFSGPKWSEIDESNNTFSYMDSKDFSWNQIDNLS